MKTAFSTTAVHDWTIDRVVALAEDAGYDGLELRSFEDPGSQFACEPDLTGAKKIRAMCDRSGIVPACVATSIGFDEPIRPPVIGRVLMDVERSVRQAKRAVQLADSIGASYVRVFGFEVRPGASRARTVDFIVERLSLALTTARHRNVQLVLENGGSFATASSLREILDRVDHPLLVAAYSPSVARAAGENSHDGVDLLGDRMAMLKCKDFAGDRPCMIGDGDVGYPLLISELERRGFAGWAVMEWHRAWIEGLQGPEELLRDSIKRLYSWRANARPSPSRRPDFVVA